MAALVPALSCSRVVREDQLPVVGHRELATPSNEVAPESDTQPSTEHDQDDQDDKNAGDVAQEKDAIQCDLLWEHMSQIGSGVESPASRSLRLEKCRKFRSIVAECITLAVTREEFIACAETISDAECKTLVDRLVVRFGTDAYPPKVQQEELAKCQGRIARATFTCVMSDAPIADCNDLFLSKGQP
jgi:hypothetical protein